jgi:hypothetical protein
LPKGLLYALKIIAVSPILALEVVWSSPDSTAQSAPDWEIPRWRVGITPFNWYSSTPSASVRRSIGRRTDIGFSVSGWMRLSENSEDYDRRNYDGDIYRRNTDEDYQDIDLGLAFEVRRWHKVNDRVTWYNGLGLGSEFDCGDWDKEKVRFETDWTDETSYDTSSHKYYDFSTFLTMGVDLQLMEHLSFSIGMTPLKLSYYWTKWEQDFIEKSPDEDGTNTGNIDEWGSRYQIEVYSKVSGLLSISF